jgi:hypothetical protein
VAAEVPRLVQNETSPILMSKDSSSLHPAKEMPLTKPIAIISAGNAGIAPNKDLLDVANTSLPIKGKFNYMLVLGRLVEYFYQFESTKKLWNVNKLQQN